MRIWWLRESLSLVSTWRNEHPILNPTPIETAYLSGGLPMFRKAVAASVRPLRRLLSAPIWRGA